MNSGNELLVQMAVKAAPDILPSKPFGGPITAIYYKEEKDSKAKLKPTELKWKALSDSKFTVEFPVKTAVAYPGSDAEELVVLLETKGEKGPKATTTSCVRDSMKKTVDQCEFKVKLTEEPKATVEYTVKVMAKDNPIPITPDTIKFTLEEKPPKPEKKTETPGDKPAPLLSEADPSSLEVLGKGQ